MNNRWYQTKSQTTHQRLHANPEEWAHYHTMYRELRESWPVIPFEEEIKWLSEPARNVFVVGDFGCGEREISKRLDGKYQFVNFDHVAIDAHVVECDLACVPYADESLDLAIFCLSLMGSDCTDYVLEAHRTLAPDGHLHIWEPASYFEDVNNFCDDLARIGFEVMRPAKIGNFYRIYARKSTERADARVVLRFR